MKRGTFHSKADWTGDGTRAHGRVDLARDEGNHHASPFLIRRVKLRREGECQYSHVVNAQRREVEVLLCDLSPPLLEKLRDLARQEMSPSCASLLTGQ